MTIRLITVVYYSKTLSKDKGKYSVTKVNMAVLLAIKNFHPFSYGTHFKVVTDHFPL